MGHILVIDVGTSSMRGILYDGASQILYVLQRRYAVSYLSQTLAQQDPRDWENGLFTIVRDQFAYAQRNGITVDAICLTCQRSSILPVTREGTPLRDAIMWLDKRNAPICDEMAYAAQDIFRVTGAHLNTVFSGSKMTWLRRNEPDIYRKAYKLMTVADYLAWLITGEMKTDHTYGSRSLLMDIRKRCWSRQMLDLFEVEPEKLCQLIPPGSVLGYTTEHIARITGCPTGVPLISAGGDQQCAALGMGVIREGDMEITTGTGGFLLACAEDVPEQIRPDVICGVHAVPGKYVLESSMLSCASLYDWYLNEFYGSTPEPWQSLYTAINRDVLSSPAGAGGCIALPYFQGRGTPDWNSQARGGFLNLTLNTTRADMARAVLEAIAMEAANNIAVLERYTGGGGSLYISGGLSHSEEYNRIQASAYDRTILQSSNAEQTALGAWVSGAVALGLYPGFADALTQAKRHDQITRYEPRPDWVEIYRKKRAEMNRAYGLLYGGTQTTSP